MNSSCILAGFVIFTIGFILTITIFGALIGIPLILASFLIMFVGLFVPSGSKETHTKIIHHYHEKNK